MNQGGAPAPRPTIRTVGRYTIFDAIASGGMATVHLGRMQGQAGFSKTVAIKILHPHLAADPSFVRMLIDEARIAARVQHPNVVSTLDVVVENGEILLVLDYVHGESLYRLSHASRQAGVGMPPAIVATVVVNALHGLHAAHDATDEQGKPLGIVHRDVSPQNILVGVDGVARVLDFGVATAHGRLQSTYEGQLKGKLAYMSPEQVRGRPTDRRTDVWAASAMLWGALAGRRLVNGANEAEVLNNVLAGGFPAPSHYMPQLSSAIDEAVMRGLQADPSRRYQTAREMAVAVEAAFGVVSAFEVSGWVKAMAADTIAMRAVTLREMESTSDVSVSMSEAGPLIVQWSGTQLLAAPPARPAAVTAPLPVAPPSAHPSHGPLAASVASSVSAVVPKRSSVLLWGAVSFTITLLVVLGAALRYGPPSWRAIAAPLTGPPESGEAATTPPPLPTPLPTAPDTSAAIPATAAATPAPTPPVIDSSAPSSVAAPPRPTSNTPAAPITVAPTTGAKPSSGPKGGRQGGPGAAKPGSDVAACSSPFYFDADGIKQIKPECL